MITICAIKSTDIERIWGDVEPILGKVLKYNWGFYTLDEIKKNLITGDSLLICVVEEGKYLSCIVCSEEPHPEKKVLHMPIVCGERMNEWLDMCSETIPKIARSLGYDMLITKGRKGWTRKLKKYGYKELYVSLGLDL